MAETGLLQPDERVELIDGEVIRMSPQDWLHSSAITLVNALLCRLYAEPYLVRVQLPLDGKPHSQPEPDFAVSDRSMLKLRPHPRAPHLVIEVAQSSLRYDKEVKAHLYAWMGVPEYWVLNVIARELEVFTEPLADAQAPFGGRYRHHSDWKHGETVRALFAPEVEVPIEAMLPPIEDLIEGET